MAVEITDKHIEAIKEAFKQKGVREVRIKLEDGEPVILAVTVKKM